METIAQLGLAVEAADGQLIWVEGSVRAPESIAVTGRSAPEAVNFSPRTFALLLVAIIHPLSNWRRLRQRHLDDTALVGRAPRVREDVDVAEA